MIIFSNIHSLGSFTGKSSLSKTEGIFGLGGCDLGYPIYSNDRDFLVFLFGDSFSDPDFLNKDKAPILDWRSQTMGYINHYLLKRKPLIMESFYSHSGNKADCLIESHHEDKLEMTKIPTGGIFINGVLYVYYFDISSWSYSHDGKMNYGGLMKWDEKDNKFIRVPDITFVNLPSGRKEAIERVINEDENLDSKYHLDIIKHTNPDFTEIYPYDNGDGYVYLLGQGSYRESPLYAARVKKESIENYEAIEYLVEGKEEPSFSKGPLINKALHPLIEDGFGEFSIINIKGRYLLFAMDFPSHDLVFYEAPSLLGPYSAKKTIIKGDDPLFEGFTPYAPVTNNVLYDEKTGVLKMLVSLWHPRYNPILVSLNVEEK